MARGSGNGGVGGSGVFGLLGTTVQCKSEDNGPYCTFAKLMNVLVWLFILYALFILARDHFKKK